MKIYVAGCNGQLGTELMRRGAKRGFVITGGDDPQLDITREESIRSAVAVKSPFTLMINAAAYTAVDRAESEPQSAYAVNRDGCALLARICREHGIALIHVSTDYVFDGAVTRPYLPSDPVQPKGVYGCSKAAGEEEIRSTLDRHIIVRTSWLFGMHGPNFVKTILRLAAERQELRIVDDQIGCPTYAGDLAEALLDTAAHVDRTGSGWGTYHFCNQGALTWYAFARRIVALARECRKLTVSQIVPILTSQYPLPAPRPAYSVLDCTSFEQTFGVVRRSWEEGLKEILACLLSEK